MTININVIEFDTASEAIQHTDASGRGQAIDVDGKNLVVEDADVRRLEEAGVAFAFLHDHEMPDGTHRLVTVPLND